MDLNSINLLITLHTEFGKLADAVLALAEANLKLQTENRQMNERIDALTTLCRQCEAQRGPLPPYDERDPENDSDSQ